MAVRESGLSREGARVPGPATVSAGKSGGQAAAPGLYPPRSPTPGASPGARDHAARNLTPLPAGISVAVMHTQDDFRIEPSAQVVELARKWLAPVRAAVGPEFIAAYLTGSVLTQGFNPKHSHVNVLVVARSLDGPRLDAVACSLPVQRKPPLIEPLFLTRGQIESSLDSFPIEWLEIQERHLHLDGDDVFSGLEVPRTTLRLQCEHELRGKHIQLRQTYLLHRSDGAVLARLLRASASGFATLFRTLLRLRGEPLPAEPARVIQRVADLYQLDAQGLLSAHLFRYSTRRYKAEEVLTLYHRFLAEVERLIGALDGLSL
jgi:hypothetical protein